MSNPLFQLSMEQEFNIRSFEEQSKKLTFEQLQECLVDLYRQMIIKEYFYKQFLKEQLGVSPCNQSK
jgi:Phycobilisome degradation protein nblA